MPFPLPPSSFHLPMPTALYTDYPWPDAEVERDMLATVGCDLIVAPDDTPPDKREQVLIDLAPPADVIITCWAPVTARVIDAAPNCKHISRTGIGLDNIDVLHATKKGILVTNVPDYCVEEVAEHALAMIFALARKIAFSHLDTKRGHYSLVDSLPLVRLRGKTVGIIGLGKTGKLLAEKAAAIGMRVLGNNRSQEVPDQVTWAPLEQLLAESDFVSLNAPLTEQTHHLINADTLAQMKPTAMLINTSRGGLVDHDALAAALTQDGIAGAGLDVQDVEPPNLSRPPYSDPRVIVTPHTAFCSPEAILELRQRVARQVVTFLQGGSPECQVNRV